MSAWLVDRLSLLLFTLMLATGQLLFKQVGLTIRGAAPRAALRLLLGNGVFYLSLVLYGVATLLWIWLLSRLPLTQAYPWVALAMAVVPMLSIVVFGERVQPVYWGGVTLIGAGIILTQYGLTP